MIWPGLVFNLCMGLLFAAYLLRAVRRFERRADKLMTELDAAHTENMRKYDIARDEIRESLHSQVDEMIAEMQAEMDRIQAELAANGHHDPEPRTDSNGTTPHLPLSHSQHDQD